MDEQAPKPDTFEHFLEQNRRMVQDILKCEVAAVMILDCADGKFFVNAQHLDDTWVMGMLKKATTTVDTGFAEKVKTALEKNREQLERIELTNMQMGGKPQ